MQSHARPRPTKWPACVLCSAEPHHQRQSGLVAGAPRPRPTRTRLSEANLRGTRSPDPQSDLVAEPPRPRPTRAPKSTASYFLGRAEITSGRSGSRTRKAHRSPAFETGAVTHRLALPTSKTAERREGSRSAINTRARRNESRRARVLMAMTCQSSLAGGIGSAGFAAGGAGAPGFSSTFGASAGFSSTFGASAGARYADSPAYVSSG